jgi:chromosome partitioning protein
MLDPGPLVDQDGAVTANGDVSERATSIFERLRMERETLERSSVAAADDADLPSAPDPTAAPGDAEVTASEPPVAPQPAEAPAETSDPPDSGPDPQVAAVLPGVPTEREPAEAAVGEREGLPASLGRAAGGQAGDALLIDQAEPAPPEPVVRPPSIREPASAVVASRSDAGETAGGRELPRIIAIANQKGGVGKTTTAVNLGAGLAELGSRVLVVDLDPQGNATTGLGINSRNLEVSIYDVLLRDVSLVDCIEPTSLRNLFVAPATIELAGAEIELVPAFSRELRLRRSIEEVRDDFDYVLIDCPPSLGLLTVNGLAAATEVLVPIQCEYYALEGLGQLLRNVNLVQANLNPRLELSTIVLTMFDARTKLAEQVVQNVRQHFGSKVCRNLVPRTVRLSEAPSFGQPVTLFDPTSRGSIAYRELAKEVARGSSKRTG